MNSTVLKTSWKYIVYIDKDNDHEDQKLQNASASLFETFSFFFLITTIRLLIYTR